MFRNRAGYSIAVGHRCRSQAFFGEAATGARLMMEPAKERYGKGERAVERWADGR